METLGDRCKTYKMQLGKKWWEHSREKMGV